MSLEVSGLSFSYGNRRVLRDLSFGVPDGSLACVLGPNGVGKTSLFRCMLGIRGYEGTVLANGHDVRELSVRERARQMAYIPQAHVNVFDYEVVDMVLMACGTNLGMLRTPTRRHEDRAMAALERVGIADLAHRSVNRLSGGQLQLVLFARAIAQDARAMILDEPTSALDFANADKVLSLAQSLAREGRSVIVSTHRPEQAYLYSDLVIAMGEGGVVGVGSPQEVVTSERMSSLYGMGVTVSSLFGDAARACVPSERLGAEAAREQRTTTR